MNRSLTRKTPEKLKRSGSVKASPTSSPNIAVSTLYFCHYKNSMYMGGIKSFKKDGRGILLHDNGVSVLSSYQNDLLHGHNIFFSQHCFLSAEFVKNKLVEAVYRTDGFLISFNYNSEGVLEGKSILLNFITKSIIYSTFKKGVMVDKNQETDFSVVNRVFDLNDLDFLIGRMHAKALKYEFQKMPNIEMQKYGNKLTIGFDKNGLTNGLGFTIIFRGSHGGYNPDTHRNQDEFQLKIIQRGYFTNSQLNGFGEKWFKNGNLYIGEFKNGIFEGNGVLKNSSKKNWVSGFFEKGNLSQLLEYNNEGEEKKYDRIIEALHERKTNWINNQIHILSLQLFDAQIQRIISTSPNMQVKSLEQRKQEVLKKIQENFICQNNSSMNVSDNIDINLLRNPSTETENMKKFVRNFIPDEQGNTKRNKQEDSRQSAFFITKDKLSSSRRNSQRKSKIFEKGYSAKSVDAALKNQQQTQSTRKRSTQRSPERKIFNESNSLARSHYRNAQNSNEPVREQEQENSEGQKDDLRSSRKSKNNEESSGNLNRSGTNRPALDSKRLVGKSKIFKYLQSQSDEITPKFMYTQLDTLKEADKKKRLGVEQSF